MKAVKGILNEDKTQRELEKAYQLRDYYFNKDSFEKKIEASTHFSGNKINILYKSPIIPESIEKPMKLEEIEQKIEEWLLMALESEPVLISLKLILTANYKKGEKMEKGLSMLKKVFENIIANPKEEKYRKIRIENGTVKENLLSLKYVDLCLVEIGF